MAANDGIDTGDYGAEDPQDILAQQANQYGKEQMSGNATDRAISNIRYGLQSAVGGGPQVQQARAVQDRMKQIIAQVQGTASDDEDPIQSQMRMASAMATGMADVSPKIAMMANDKMVKLQQASTQQKYLQAETADKTAQTQEAQLKTAQGKVASNYIVFDSGKDQTTGLPSMQSYGQPLSLYKPDGSIDPDFYTKLNKQMQDAKDQGANAPMYLPADAYQNGKGAVADTRAKVQLAQAQLKAQQQAQADAAGGSFDPDVLKAHVAFALQNPQYMRSIDPAERDAVLKTMVANGLSPLDGPAIQAEVKALNAAATQIGSRDGKTLFLESSIPKLGDTVLDTLNNVDRTRFPALNSIIIAGKDASGNAAERAYSTAIQSYVSEYARVISGGTGVTSDAARKDAQALLNKADSPEAIKSALSVMRDKELAAFQGAGPAALAMITNPEKYPHLNRLSGMLGFDSAHGFGLDPNAGVGSGENPNPNPPPKDSPAVAAGKASLQQPTVHGLSNKPDGTPGTFNGKPVVVKNGQWVDAS